MIFKNNVKNTEIEKYISIPNQIEDIKFEVNPGHLDTWYNDVISDEEHPSAHGHGNFSSDGKSDSSSGGSGDVWEFEELVVEPVRI